MTGLFTPTQTEVAAIQFKGADNLQDVLDFVSGHGGITDHHPSQPASDVTGRVASEEHVYVGPSEYGACAAFVDWWITFTFEHGFETYNPVDFALRFEGGDE